MGRLKKTAKNAIIDEFGDLKQGDPIAYYYTSYGSMLTLQPYVEYNSEEKTYRGYIIVHDNDDTIIKKTRGMQNAIHANSIEKWLIENYGNGEKFGQFTRRDVIDDNQIGSDNWDKFEKAGFDLESYYDINSNPKITEEEDEEEIGYDKDDENKTILEIIIEYKATDNSIAAVDNFIDEYYKYRQSKPETRQNDTRQASIKFRRRVKLSTNKIKKSTKLLKKIVEAAIWDDVLNFVRNDQQKFFTKSENGELLILNVATYSPEDNNNAFIAVDKDENGNVIQFYAIFQDLNFYNFNTFLDAEAYLLNNSQVVFVNKNIESEGKLLGLEDLSGNSQWDQYVTKNQQLNVVELITRFLVIIPSDQNSLADEIRNDLQELKDFGDIDEFSLNIG